jgi:hypothetical protein
MTTLATDVLDQMQAKVEAVLRQHNATTDPRKMHLLWGEGLWAFESRHKKHEGSDVETREARLTFDGEDFEVHLCMDSPDRPGWLTVRKYLGEFRPLPREPEAAVGVLQGACFPMVKVDLFPGTYDDDGRLTALAVSTTAFVEGLAARTLAALLEGLIASAEDVEDRLSTRNVGDHLER